MKTILLFAMFGMLYTASFSQYIYRSTEYTNPVATDAELGINICKDASGNMYAVGIVNNGSNDDISLSKYNILGVLQWERFYDNGGDDTPIKVEIGESDNIYITGNSEVGSVNKALIAKYNASGTLQWDIHNGGASGKTLLDSKTNSAGKTVLVGYYSASSTEINGFVAKYNEDASYAWGQIYDYSSAYNNDKDYFNSVTINNSTNDIYIGGHVRKNAGSPYFNKMLILKYNSSGVQQWVENTKEGTITDILGYGLFSNFRVYVSGLDIDGSDEDTYFAQYNTSGTLQWETTQADDLGFGNSYIKGFSSNFYVVYQNSSASDKMIKYNNSGTNLWEASITDGYIDNEHNIHVNSNGVFVNASNVLLRLDISDGSVLQTLSNDDEASIYTEEGLKENEGQFYGNSIIENNGIIYTLGTGERDGASEIYKRIALQSYCAPVSNALIDAPASYCGTTITLNVLNATSVDWAYTENTTPPYHTTSVSNFSDYQSLSPEITITSNRLGEGGKVNLYIKGLDENTCPSFDSHIIIEHRQDFLSTDALVPASNLNFCSGGNTVLNVDEPYYTHNSIIWKNIDTDLELISYENLESATITEAGNFHVIITNEFSCIDTTETETTLIIGNPSVNLGADIVECADLAVNINSGNIAENYNFLWSNGETTETIDVYDANTYSVTVSGSGCVDAIDEIEITRTANAKPNLGADANICLGDFYTLDAGSSALSYLWSTGETTQTISTDIAGEYIVEVDNGAGCSNSDTINIISKRTGFIYTSDDVNNCAGTSVNLSVDSMFIISDYFDYYENVDMDGLYNYYASHYSTTTNCNGNKDLQIGSYQETGFVYHKMDVTPGIDEFYLDVNVRHAINISQLPVNIDGQQYYMDFVTGCGNTTHLHFTGMSSYTADGEVIVRFDDESSSMYDGTLYLTDITARCLATDVYNWYSNPTGFTSANQNITVNPTEPTQYIATYDYNACTIRDTVNVNVTNVDLGSDITVCEGETVVIDAGTADSYLWSTGATTQTISVTTNNTYSVDVSKDGCDVSDEINVTFTQLPSVNLGVDIDFCQGESQILDAGTLNIDSYEWNTGEATQTLSVSAGGIYTVTATNTCGVVSDNITVIVNANPSPSINGDLEYCAGNNTNIASSTDGTYISYLWSNGESIQTITVTAGTYTVEVEDDNGCVGTSASVTVVENANPIPVITGDLEYCEGAEATLDAGLYSSYNWSNATPTQTTNVYFGTYTVEVTDANGCVGTSASVTVVENANPIPVITGDLEYCEGENASLSTGSGYVSYVWKKNESGWIEIDYTQSTTVTEGYYIVEVEDANGCIGESGSTAHVVENALPSVNLTPYDASCNESNGIVALTINSGSSLLYLWSNGATTQTISDIPSGNYTVTVTDGNGCESINSAIVNEQNAPDLSSTTTDVTCEGDNNGEATVVITGGLAPYTITWNDANAQDTETATNLLEGTYTVTITDDNSCSSYETVTIDALYLNPTPVITGDLAYCEGSNVVLDAGSGFSFYTWSNTDAGQTSSVTAGTYTVEVEDGNGCVGTSESVIVVENANPTPTITGDLAYCEGENTVLDAGSGFSFYTWSNTDAGQTSSVTAGTYTVEVEDANGCVGTSTSVDITENTLPIIFLGNDTIVCDNEVFVLDAGNFETYLWADGSDLQTLEVSTTGIYSVEVTDANGCSNTDEIDVEVTVCIGITERGKAYSISVYPNPAKDYLVIEAKNISLKKLEVLDITGKLIKTVISSKAKQSVDVSSLQKGVYFMKIQLENKTELVKFIKQ